MGGIFSTVADIFSPSPQRSYLSPSTTSHQQFNDPWSYSSPRTTFHQQFNERSVIQKEILSPKPQVSKSIRYYPIRHKRDEFLYRIFEWDPAWLEDEQYDSAPPSIIDSENMTPTLLSYTNFNDYSTIMTPLLMHEYWYTLKQNLEDRTNDKTEIPSIVAFVLESTFDHSSIDSITNRKILRFSLTVIVKSSETYPSNGDLVKFKQPGNQNNEIFAYVEELFRRRVKINRKNNMEVRTEERTQLTYKLVTKVLERSAFPRALKFTTVTWLSSYLTLIDSLLYIPKSSLFEAALSPKIGAYQISSVVDINAVPIVTEHKLNLKQREVVARVAKTVEEGKPRICLIQGPPGTGKSRVIVNMVASMLKKNSTNRILLCAPSNKAIDEVVLRLLEIKEILQENNVKLNIVRVGREEKMHPTVKKISLSTLALCLQKASIPSNNNTDKLYQIKERILTGANVIACTLTSCYTSYQMKSIFGTNGLKIPVCIVDEAAQATELATLTPLMLGVSTLVLVGDPQQLPPTVLSQKAKEFKLDQSLFARAQKLFDSEPRNPILMLDTQYRMVDSIAQWPNRYFYKGALRNSASVKPLCFFNYKFLNHSSPQDDEDDRFNMGEARLVANVIQTLMTQSNMEKSNAEINVGIITPYKIQRTIIMQLLKARLAGVSKQIQSKMKITDVNTVDSFQGSERDIIIMSCVRSSGIGFIKDPHRLCVSLTRAKHSLIICGNFNTFRRDPMWRDLLNDAQSRGVYVNINHNARVQTIKQHVISNISH